MAGYPNLFPSGFIEFDDSCSGPLLYRDQPSRENSYGITLNEFMNKYAGSEITNYDFLNVLTYIKYLNKHWKSIPQRTRDEIINLLNSSNGNIKLNNNNNINIKEHFGNGSNDSNECSKQNMNIMTLVIVSIVSVIIGFLICIISKNVN